jgi:hypothetical protein
MKLHLSLTNPNNKLAAEIAAVIKEYYPIGLKANTDEYSNHPAFVKLNNKIGEHMTNYNAYIKPWKSFLLNLPKGFKSKIHNHGFAHDISYGGELTLEKYEDEKLIRKKKIIFSVSWLGPFYTIYGIDETVIKDERDGRDLFYHAINVITVSPYKEFESAFNYLRAAIEENFKDYKFVPFMMCSSSITDLENLFNPYYNKATVNNTIFSGILDRFDLSFIHPRGDRRYGFEQGSGNNVVLIPPPQ